MIDVDLFQASVSSLVADCLKDDFIWGGDFKHFLRSLPTQNIEPTLLIPNFFPIAMGFTLR